MYLPHTWRGEANLEEYYETLKETDENSHEVKLKYNISGIIAGVRCSGEAATEAVRWKWHESLPREHCEIL